MRIIVWFFTLVAFLAVLPAYANVFYRHVPFNLVANHQDEIVVEYDFSEKKSIRCIANQPNVYIQKVTYKGHQNKSAQLPVTLQSDHIPEAEQKDEMLADVEGTFHLVLGDSRGHVASYQVSCHYLQ